QPRHTLLPYRRSSDLKRQPRCGDPSTARSSRTSSPITGWNGRRISPRSADARFGVIVGAQHAAPLQRFVLPPISKEVGRVRFVPFELERWQSTWENRVRFNLSESGVHPLSIQELLGLAGASALPLLEVRLGYS